MSKNRRTCTLYIGGTADEHRWMKEKIIPALSTLEGIVVTATAGNYEIPGPALEYDAGNGCGYFIARGATPVALYANMLYESLKRKE